MISYSRIWLFHQISSISRLMLEWESQNLFLLLIFTALLTSNISWYFMSVSHETYISIVLWSIISKASSVFSLFSKMTASDVKQCFQIFVEALCLQFGNIFLASSHSKTISFLNSCTSFCLFFQVFLTS